MNVIARLDRAIQYPQAGGYWIARSSRAMTAQRELRRGHDDHFDPLQQCCE
jgi:hypothetical protein